MKTHPGRPGFTLLEMILVLAVVGVFLAMGSALLYGYARLHTTGARNLDSMTRWREMADNWRRDVRLSNPTPPMAERPKNATTELLLNPRGEPVVWKVEDGKIIRQSKKQKTERSWSLGPGKTWGEFVLMNLDKTEVLELRHGENRVTGKFVQGEYGALRGGDLP